MDVRSRPDSSIIATSVMAVMLATALVGCDKPLVGVAGTPQVAGGIEFQISDYDVRYLEINDGDNTYEYPRPVLRVPLSIKNVAEESFVYSPSHGALQMTEAATPILYLDPGAEADLPPASKNLISGVVLDKGAVEGQVVNSTTLAKGDSLQDILLFEVPDGPQKLILSIPPAMHRGKLPLLFRIDYKPVEPKGPKVFAVGQEEDFDGVTFSVTGSELGYVKTKDAAQGEGFSSDPLFKVSYEIKNGTAAAIKFEPGHKAVNLRGAAIYGADSAFNRVKFAATTMVDGQVQNSVTVEPGKSATDFVLFEAPPKEVTQVSFEYPASLFGRTGLARFNVPFEWKDVPQPKELQK